jgi:colanic acid/amylovoran biosynthesis protein
LQQRALLSAYYDADLVLSCGGGNFYAYRTVCIAFLWALLCVAFASALGKRIVMLPQSIGPIKGWFQRHLARLMFARADRIMLREQLSLDLLRELKVNVLMYLVPDLAFGLPPVLPKPNRPIERGSALHIGVTVMDRGAQHNAFIGQRSYEDVVVSVLLKFHQTCGVYLHIFSQCFGPTPDQDDRRCARRVYERLRKQIDAVALHDTFRDALEIKQAYESMDCMIGTRAHTAIFALSSAIPVVLIGYQPKAYGIMQLFGLEHYCCPIESLTEETLFRLVDEVLINRDSISSYIAQRYQQIREWLKDWGHYLED